METDEPTPIEQLLPPGATASLVEQPPQGLDMDTLVQLMGQREVEILMLRQQVASLKAQAAELQQAVNTLLQQRVAARHPRREESDTPSR